MRLTIQATGFQLTQALRTHTELRVGTALGWASEHIRQLHVFLSDINGPRGGVDKRCRLQVVMDSGREVIIEDLEADLYVAINRATDRADRAVVRKIQRSRAFSHQRPAPMEVTEFPGDPDAHCAGSIR
ncbi:MAG: HPF/RaiA family ribosome-associated protein [Pseudomonadota bacterium]